MRNLVIRNRRKVLQNKKILEKALKIKISVGNGFVIISGSEADEYFAERVLLAMDFPFLVEDALLLKSDDYVFDVLNIKDFTKRNDLTVVKGRIIGKKGNTLRVLEELSEAYLALRDNSVAIISPVELADSARQAVISLIQGSKQGNVYSYLEKSRKRKN